MGAIAAMYLGMRISSGYTRVRFVDAVIVAERLFCFLPTSQNQQFYENYKITYKRDEITETM